MKKMILTAIFLTMFISSAYSACDFNQQDVCVWACDVVDNGVDEATFTICVDSNVDIAGFQFDFGAENSDWQMTSCAPGADNNFPSMSCSGSTVIDFGFGNPPIAPGTSIEIAEVTGSYSWHDNNSVVQVIYEVISKPNATPASTLAISNDWDGMLLDGELPAEYTLREAYPNPFNPTTTIEYNVETAGNVSIIVYDLMGREVKELVNDFKSPSTGGNYSAMWDGTNNSGNIVSSGMYIYRMISNDFTKTHRLTLMK